MNADFLTVLEFWEREKGISREILVAAVEESLLSAAKKAVGPARELRATIDQKNGDIKAFAKLVVGVTPTFSIATKATSASDHLYYSNANGNLYYDADGNGATAPHLIAHFGAGLHLTASNFTVV